MKIENQVTSFELAQQLKALGVTQDSLFWWVQIDGAWKLRIAETEFDLRQLNRESHGNICAAFTVGELGMLLPENACTIPKVNDERIKGGAMVISDDNKRFMDKTEAGARANMLIYLLENKLMPL